MDNYFDQFDNPPTAPQANAGGNYFDQFDGPSASAQSSPSGMSTGPSQPSWYPIAQGVLPFGIAPRVEAATAAAKESLSGGLPFSQAYSQALTQYQNAGDKQEAAHPVLAPIGKAIGSIVPLTMGGEAVNAGLESLGPLGRFLAGSADIPTAARAANGQFQALGPAGKIGNAITSGASTTAMMAREGAQAGAFGAANSPNGDVSQGALQGGTVGGVVGLLGGPVTASLAQAARLPSALAGSLPHSLQGVAGLLGGQQLLEHAPELYRMAIGHPIAAAGVAGTSALLAASRYLAQNPQLRDALMRMGVSGAGAWNGAQQ